MITIPGRIPIRIHPIFWFLMFFIGWLNGGTHIPYIIAWAAVVLFSVLIHEFGHALTALAFGQKVSIDLVGLGGLTQQYGKKLKLWQEFIVVLNGPIAGFLLAFAASALWQEMGMTKEGILAYTVVITMYANIFWSIINLLPIYPLDGGRLLGIILEAIFGLRGLKASFLVGFIFAGLIGLWFFSKGSLFNGSIFLLLAFEGYRAWQTTSEITKTDQNSDLQKIFKDAEEKFRLKQYLEAKNLFRQVRQLSAEGVLYNNATEYLANILDQEGNTKDAILLLEEIQNKLSPEGLSLLHELAYRNQEWRKTIDLGDETYQVYPNYHTALINSLAYAILGEVRPSTGWLQRAIDDGLPNLQAILSKSEYDKVRSSPQFQAFLKKYSD